MISPLSGNICRSRELSSFGVPRITEITATLEKQRSKNLPRWVWANTGQRGKGRRQTRHGRIGSRMRCLDRFVRIRLCLRGLVNLDSWCWFQLFKALGRRAAEVLNKHSNRVKHVAQSQQKSGGGLINVWSGANDQCQEKIFFLLFFLSRGGFSGLICSAGYKNLAPNNRRRQSQEAKESVRSVCF